MRKNAFEREPMLPPGVRRQLLFMVGLLVVVVGLSYRLVMQLRFEEATVVEDVAGLPSHSLGVDAGDEDELAPLEPQPPEPFEERPEVLSAARRLDRTADLDDEATIHLFHRLLADPDAFRDGRPVLSLRTGSFGSEIDGGDAVAGGGENAPTDGQVWEHLLAQPDRYRGTLVEVFGVLVSPGERLHPLQLRGLPYPNPSGRDRAFASYLYGTDDRYYIVASLEPQLDLRHRDRVRLRAYFCQLYTNDVEVDGEIQKGTVPYLVGETYERIETPVTWTRGGWTVYLPFLILLPGLLFTVMYVLHQRTTKSYERRRRRARAVARGRGASRAADGSEE